MVTVYGIISDIHQAHPSLVKVGIDVLVKEGANKLILNGDLVGDRFQDENIDEQNYAALVLQIAAKSGKEVIAIEGSHECLPLWIPVIQTLQQKYTNIIDAIECPKIEEKDHDIILLPGSDWHAGKAAEHGGYLLHEKIETGIYQNEQSCMAVTNINDLKKITTRPEETILFTHIPKKFEDVKEGVDMAYFAQNILSGEIMPGIILESMIKEQMGDISYNVIEEIAAGSMFKFKKENRGNKDLKNVMEQVGINKNITGHFHESVHRAHDNNCKPINESIKTNELFWNASYLDDGKVGLLTVEAEMVSYRNINLREYLR
jgi:hypothetical protein